MTDTRAAGEAARVYLFRISGDARKATGLAATRSTVTAATARARTAHEPALTAAAATALPTARALARALAGTLRPGLSRRAARIAPAGPVVARSALRCTLACARVGSSLPSATAV